MERSTSTAVIAGHRIELTNIEVYERLTDETTAFSADITIDGHKGEVSNDGRGGCNDINIYPFKDIRPIIDEIDKECRKHEYSFALNREIISFPYSFDFFISEMVELSWYDGEIVYQPF